VVRIKFHASAEYDTDRTGGTYQRIQGEEGGRVRITGKFISDMLESHGIYNVRKDTCKFMAQEINAKAREGAVYNKGGHQPSNPPEVKPKPPSGRSSGRRE